MYLVIEGMTQEEVVHLVTEGTTGGSGVPCD